MTHSASRAANILGATVLGLFDELRAVTETHAGRAGEGSAALVVLGHQPGLSNDGLSRLLGLTHTGTVRLVDRLVDDGLVDRRGAPHDRRAVALFLTDAGEAARAEILAEREKMMRGLLECLVPRDQAKLAELLGKLLQRVSRDDAHKLRICRLCDSDACGACPIHVPLDPIRGNAQPETEAWSEPTRASHKG
jgi:MarR family transcriptional repressor of emrRAB